MEFHWSYKHTSYVWIGFSSTDQTCSTKTDEHCLGMPGPFKLTREAQNLLCFNCLTASSGEGVGKFCGCICYPFFMIVRRHLNQVTMDDVYTEGMTLYNEYICI